MIPKALARKNSRSKRELFNPFLFLIPNYVCRTEQKPVTTTEYKDECRTEYDEVCNSTPRTECNAVQRSVPQTVYERSVWEMPFLLRCHRFVEPSLMATSTNVLQSIKHALMELINRSFQTCSSGIS